VTKILSIDLNSLERPFKIYKFHQSLSITLLTSIIHPLFATCFNFKKLIAIIPLQVRQPCTCWLIYVCPYLSNLDKGAVWMWCTIQGIFMLCVVSVVIMMVINVDIGMHDNYQVC